MDKCFPGKNKPGRKRLLTYSQGFCFPRGKSHGAHGVTEEFRCDRGTGLRCSESTCFSEASSGSAGASLSYLLPPGREPRFTHLFSCVFFEVVLCAREHSRH